MKTIVVALIALCATAGAVAQGSPACAIAPGSSPGDELNLGLAVAVIPSDMQDQEKAPPDSVFVDVLPSVKKRLNPKYPQLAAKAGIEGEVWVKVWVDKAGNAREVKILKTDNEIFNEASLNAARGFEFTPATVGGKPVSVWITFPFKYKLMDKTTGTPSRGVPVGLQSALDGVETILMDEKPEKCESCYAPDAHAVVGSRYVLLSDAIGRRGTAKGLPDERGWKIDLVTTHMDDAAQMATLIIRTVGKKKDEFHYHTVVCTRNSEGKWQIRHWHTAG
jgi:TonB family protein